MGSARNSRHGGVVLGPVPQNCPEGCEISVQERVEGCGQTSRAEEKLKQRPRAVPPPGPRELQKQRPSRRHTGSPPCSRNHLSTEEGQV